MKLKNVSHCSLGMGAALLLCGLILPFAVYSGGTIGGADGPTFRFLVFHRLHSLPVALVLLGSAMLMTGLVCLLGKRIVRENCTAVTSLLALTVSALLALELCCGLLFIASVAFGGAERHPRAIPVSIFGGGVSFLGLCYFGYRYLVKRKSSPARKGVLLDILLCAVYLPGFIYLFNSIYSFLRT